jgi:hypothetical protein
MDEWVVRSAGLVRRNAPLKDYDEFVCEVENGGGIKAKFALVSESENDSRRHAETYRLVKPHLRVGALVQFGSAYQLTDDSFALGFYDLLPLTPYRVNGGVISADDYLNPNRGYWVHSRHHGKRIPFPCGFITCWGDVHIPLVESGGLPHVPSTQVTGEYRQGLRYGRRRSGLEELFLELFPPKRNPVALQKAQ